MTADFRTLDSIFRMITPADLAGRLQLSLGDPSSKDAFIKILGEKLLEQTGSVLTLQMMKQEIDQLSIGASDTTKLSSYLKLFSSAGSFSFASQSDNTFVAPDGKTRLTLTNINQVVGKNFALDANKQLGFLLVNAPFVHPATRNAGKVNVFLNNMPPLVVARMSPLFDIEFQLPRDAADSLQSMSQLKFQMGAKRVSELSEADKQMYEAGMMTDESGKRSFSFAGMEMFTSPQTLVNPNPNESIGRSGTRYVPVLDPFRPFASIESFEVSVTPAVGTFTYKKAKLTIKLHDKSRLAEISDFIRPRVYSGVTIWVTYGWLMQNIQEDPYADYVNKYMRVTEPYGIVNSSFSFDRVGQVTITLELFTKCVSEMRQQMISDNFGSPGSAGSPRAIMSELRTITDRIYELRKQLKLDPPEGLNKEIRVYQLLDAAQAGESPQFSKQEIKDLIQQLSTGLAGGSVDKGSANALIDSLKKLYATDSAAAADYRTRFESSVAAKIQEKFKEVLEGADPFITSQAKIDVADKTDADRMNEIMSEIAKYNKEPVGKAQTTAYQKGVVSFGKLFATFVVPAILDKSMKDVEELQVFFYQFNDQCGLVSSHNIAEFPIDLQMFMDQYKEHVVRRGGEHITIEEFLGLVINAQFLDDRAIGYGLRSYYQPYDPKNKEAQLIKDKEKEFENKLANMIGKFGGWKKPAIEMLIEAHALNSSTEPGDIKKALRIHIYDKQLSPYKQAGALLRNEAGSGFLERPATNFASSVASHGLTELDVLKGIKELEHGGLAIINDDGTTTNSNSPATSLNISSNQHIKNVISQHVPTITVGSNGSTVSEANLASKAEPLLSTVNMMRSMTVKNTAAPNGAGDAGLPLRVIPASLSLTTMGCPLATMAQHYFIDFSTGTTLDNLYIVTGITHQITPGKFETSWQFGYADGYGRYEGAPNIVEQIKKLSGDFKT